MVNHGASRGCETCKKRRKKCDETRPVCDRCRKAGKECLGYKDSEGLLFRHYTITSESRTDISSLPAPHESQSLPEPNHHPQHEVIPEEGLNDGTLLELFYHDYVVEAVDRSMSRGFLDGFKTLVEAVGETSDLAKAARMITCATKGNIRKSPKLVRRSHVMYGEIVRSFKNTISNPVTAKTTQALMTAVLLGVYEIISASRSDPGQTKPHVLGIAALLARDTSPFKLHVATTICQIGDPLGLKGELDPIVPKFTPKSPGILCAPFSNGSIASLDSILLNFYPIRVRAEALWRDPATSIEDMRATYDRLLRLDGEMHVWAESRVPEWRAHTLGHVSAAEVEMLRPYVFRPGKVDVYYDLYISQVWNTYRKTRILLLDWAIRLARRIDPSDTCRSIYDTTARMADMIIASVPYHLLNETDLQQYFTTQDSMRQPSNPDRSSTAVARLQKHTFRPSRPIGGLLTLHPIWVISKSISMPEDVVRYARWVLAWLGREMGIGQAELLAEPSLTPDFQSIAQGHVLIWAGMLLHPAGG